MKKIYLGNECGLTWPHHTNLTPLLKAYPDLEYFAVRGTIELSFLGIEHDYLRTLIMLIIEGKLPNLEHLEL
ncbi:MAG: hypothetical protein ACFFAS_17075 [Promethearchaeota archaeon]